MAKPHAVIVPSPAQGHTNPMLKVAKLLYQKGFYITFVVNEYVGRRYLQARGPNALDGLPDFKFAAVPDGVDFGDALPDPILHCDQLMKDVPLPFFRRFVHELASSTDVPPITCIVCDGTMKFPLKVAEELGVPSAVFWTPSACGMLCYAYFHKLVEKGILPLKDESCLTNGYLDTVIDFIPAMKGIRLRDFPNFVRTTNLEDVMFKFAVSKFDKAYKASALFLNTMDALEREALDAFSAMFPPVYTIGPLQLLEEKQIPKSSELENIGLTMWTEDLDCLAWLDKKEPNSVIYVNFGSVARMTSKELFEFGWGLANSKQDFLWAIRPDLVLGESAVFPPEEEVERLVRELMVGENGKRMKAKAKEWKKVAEDAVIAPVGSSCMDFDNLVNKVLLSKFPNN
ncbi:hypothetical protein RHGRI_021548 [Rhododendron griersonianum]|uniref:Uncharacterized protein n=1 Tax=Rhododendron griersonianum TaxID=479676 RepID=A0AAV6JQU6_9ERIC|nr:hypothetical protein RHGRI_021548 [Rhododendron griersonianum]